MIIVTVDGFTVEFKFKNNRPYINRITNNRVVCDQLTIHPDLFEAIESVAIEKYRDNMRNAISPSR